MKLSLSWLQQYIDHGLSAEDLAHRLTMAGLEVEAVENAGADTVFAIEVTPNRPDCLSILGLAREVSAICDKDLNPPAVEDRDDLPDVSVEIGDADACGRYIATVIDGVQVKAFPADRAALLRSLGAKPIGNIVDITNFVLFEFGQPLHAFDFDKLEGGKVIVRRAKKGEKIITLDDIERTLDESILVIADAKRPVAIAGIMGGRDTAVTLSTKRILLESAHFDLGIVRRASRKLGLTSDSAYRFERGVAWKNVETAANRATDMILELAGGAVVARKDVVAQEPDLSRVEISVTAGNIQDLLGAPIDLARGEKILRRLGCVVAPGAGALTVVPPLWRQDLRLREDIVEEIARVAGYDNLPMTLPRVKAVNISVDLAREHFMDRVRDICVGLGANEIVTYALTSRAALEKSCYEGEAPIGLQNPLSAEQEVMRPTALPGFLTVAASNMNKGQRDLRLFEVGKKYLPAGERWTLSVLMTGKTSADWRKIVKATADFYDVKGLLEGLAGILRVPALSFVSAVSGAFEPGETARVSLNGTAVGIMGRVSRDVLTAWDIKKAAVYFAEIDLEVLRDAAMPVSRFEAPDEYPAAVRDISLAVKDTPYAAIRQVCCEVGGDLLRKIDFVECYTGDKIESGYRGYVVSLTYQSRERTLKDGEISALHEDITQKLVEKFGVKRR